ncbi:MAG: acetoacetate decarboxylase [bacterium]|nr:acetoacetate decarboxylase [bacterium]
MNKKEVLEIQSMPAASASYGKPPYRFIDREYFIVSYQGDPELIKQAVPEPLVPDGSNTVLYEWIKMPDSSGLGSYEESGVVIPCTYEGEAVNFVAQMYLDNGPAILAGREIWGFPKKWARPSMRIEETETLTGTLDYNNIQVALGTMPFKYETLDHGDMVKAATKTNVNLKLIPDVDGTPKVAQLVAYNLSDVTIKGAWTGPAQLHLIPHINAPVAAIPVQKINRGIHFNADITLPYGRVLFDYLG